MIVFGRISYFNSLAIILGLLVLGPFAAPGQSLDELLAYAQDSINARRFSPQTKSLIKKAVHKAGQQGQKQEEANLILIDFFDATYQYDSIIHIARPIATGVRNDSLKAYYYIFTARAYGRIGKVDTALIFANQAIQLMRKAGDKKGEIRGFVVKGGILFGDMRDDYAYQTYDSAIVLMTLYKDSSLFVPIMGNMASCLIRLGEYESAKVVLIKLKNSLPKNSNKLGFVYCNLGITYTELDSAEKAMQYYLDAIPQLEKVGSSMFLGTVYHNLAGLYVGQKNGTEALKYAQLSEPLFQQAQPTRMGVVYTGYGNVYMLLKEFDKAENYFKKALDFALEYEQWYEASTASDLLKQLYKEQGNYKMALFYIEEYVNYTEKIKEQEKLEAIEKYKNSFELSQKEKQIKSLEQINAAKNERLLAEKKLRQITIAVSIAVFLLLVLGAYLFYKFRVYRLETANRAKLAELNNKLVLTRLSPHFIFNVLNSVQYYINANDKEKANNYLTSFADLMLNFLRSISKESHSIKKEIELLEEYALLEQMLKNDAFSFTIEIPPEIDQQAQIPTMLLQPIVENAIQHGTTNNNPWVKVVISQTNESLVCVIEDNGTGITGEINEEQSNGIKLSKERVIELSTALKKPFKLTWTNKTGSETGVKVTVTIPK
jgi:tetratricopeptide (TPR) repeat protein